MHASITLSPSIPVTIFLADQANIAAFARTGPDAWAVTIPDGGITYVEGIHRVNLGDQPGTNADRIALDVGINESAGKAALLVQAANGTLGHIDGTLFHDHQALAGAMIDKYIEFFDAGHTMNQAITQFLAATPLSNKEIVDGLWLNIMGTEIPQATEALFVSMIDNGSYTQASFAEAATMSAANQLAADFVGINQHGLHYYL